MPLIRPFAGLRPTPETAAAVAAPPYDVVSAAEAAALAEGRPWSFLHVSRPEIDLPAGTNPYAPEVYAQGARAFQAMRDQGILVQDSAPGYYAYRMVMGTHVQTGLVVAASVDAYDANRIRKHEFTRPDKEDDRVRQVEALSAQTGPVLLACPDSAELASLLDGASGSPPLLDVTAETGVRHSVWPIMDQEVVARISTLFDAMDALYIADGHHRSAAASRVCAARRQRPGGNHPDAAHCFFLAVVFPQSAMRIMDYNRVVRDLNGLSVPEFLAALEPAFTVTSSGAAVAPDTTGVFGVYVPGQWYRLTIRPDRIPTQDPVASLDVSLLTDQLLAPILGIHDLRRDSRIDFVGGVRGLGELERRVDSGDMAAAFSLHPTRMSQLMAVADAGEVMPPKSTWFEPKLADGLVSHLLD